MAVTQNTGSARVGFPPTPGLDLFKIVLAVQPFTHDGEGRRAIEVECFHQVRNRAVHVGAASGAQLAEIAVEL
jgi:hypothetical protein